MNYIRFIGGPASANGYLIYDRKLSGVVIDPVDTDYLCYLLKLYSIELKAVLLTHGHFDHICGLSSLVEKFPIPVYAHRNDIQFLNDPQLNCAPHFWYTLDEFVHPELIVPIKNKDRIEISLMKFRVAHMPGHTQGSVCYVHDGNLFTGDTLFKGSVGRSDLPTGNSLKLQNSLRRIMTLKDSIKVFPGHGDLTSVGEERINNPFLKFDDN